MGQQAEPGAAPDPAARLALCCILRVVVACWSRGRAGERGRSAAEGLGVAEVPESQRIAAIRRLGASEPLIRLASGECVHPTFRNSCLGPPYYVYHEASVPVGPPFVPLWDHGDTVVGVWERADGPEFIEFSIEADDEVWRLARTEQGFWATRFDFLYECDIPLEELRAAATAVGFRFVDRHLAAREADTSRFGSFEGHAAWLREFVAGIDREGSDAEPGAAADGGGM